MSRNRRGKDWEHAQPERDINNRQFPHHPEAEASILGGIILSNEALVLLDKVEVDDFFEFRHKVVFGAIRNLEASGTPIDVVTLENEIQKTGKLEAVGGIAFLGELTMRVPTVDNVEAYAEIVRKHRITRDVMMMLSNMLDEAFHGESEGEALVHDVTTALMSIGTGGDRPIVTMATLIAQEAQRVIDDVEAKLSGKQVFSGIPSGIALLDEKIGGHPRAVPTLYIGRPGNGKTLIAMHCARSSAEISGEDSLIATYEDRGQSFGQRALGHESGLVTELIRARKLSRDDLVSIAAGWSAGTSRGESLIAASGMSVESLVRRVRRENLKRRHQGKKPFGQLIVDYLQKMPMPEHTRTPNDGITHIMQVLGAAAVAEDMALVVMAQLNREVEKRDDHRPRLSDIRDSGSAEQDGKVILGLYHPWLYEPTKFAQSELRVMCLKNAQGENHFDIKLFWDVKSHAVYGTEVEYQAARAKRTAYIAEHARRRSR